MINFFTYILYFFFILISILGFGTLLKNYFKIDLENNCYGYTGLIGTLVIFIYSYFSNFFIPHGKVHNLIFLLLGFCAFFYFNNKKYKFFKKEIINTVIIFSILTISIFIFKSHDDFAYYHFPYSFYLTEQKMVIGIGQILQGFRTPSAIFYFNSLLYLPFAEYYMFNFFPVYILGFANLILIKKIFDKNFNNNNNLNFINFLSLLAFIFINIFFYRIAEHGTDRSAQILIFVLIIEILFLINGPKIEEKKLYKIYFLISLIISLKAFYFLYLIFLFPLIAKELKANIKINYLINKYIFNRFFLVSSLLTLLVCISYFFNTGCLVYPVSFTCFENLDWAVNKLDVRSGNDWFELWSKAGATPNYIIENPKIYIEKFNWVHVWISEYFFNKVSDFLLGIFVLCFIVYLFFIKNGKIQKLNKKKISYLSVYIILLLLIFEWFYNHPALRYGGFSIISLVFFIPISLYIQRIKIDKKKYYNLALILIIITSSVFFIRNINRINKEIKIYDYKPFFNPSYVLGKTHFRMQEFMNSLIINYKNCKKQNLNCDINLKPRVSKVLDYYLINKKEK